MHRLSEPSAPLVVFLIVMTGGSGIFNPSILVLAVLLLCVLGSGVHSMHWRGFALVGVSLSFIVLGFEMMVAQQSQSVSKTVAKCSTDCFIELQVSWWQYNTGKCDALESSQYRQGCRTVIQLPPSQVWLPGARYRVHGRLFIPRDSAEGPARLKAHGRAVIGVTAQWSVFLVKQREALRSFVRETFSSGSRDCLGAYQWAARAYSIVGA